MEAMLENGEVVPVIALYDGKPKQRTPRNEVETWEEATAFMIRRDNGDTALVELDAIELANLAN